MFTKTQLTVNVCIISVIKTQLNPAISIVYLYLKHKSNKRITNRYKAQKTPGLIEKKYRNLYYKVSFL